MIHDSGLQSGGSVSRGMRQDDETRQKLAERQKMRDNINEIDEIFHAIAESFPAVFGDAR